MCSMYNFMHVHEDFFIATSGLTRFFMFHVENENDVLSFPTLPCNV